MWNWGTSVYKKNVAHFPSGSCKINVLYNLIVCMQSYLQACTILCRLEQKSCGLDWVFFFFSPQGLALDFPQTAGHCGLLVLKCWDWKSQTQNRHFPIHSCLKVNLEHACDSQSPLYESFHLLYRNCSVFLLLLHYCWILSVTVSVFSPPPDLVFGLWHKTMIPNNSQVAELTHR